MADLRRIARRAFELPPRVVLDKARAAILRPRAQRAARRADRGRSTYFASGSWGPLLTRLPYLGDIRLADEQRQACERYLDHRFDILGSGWIGVGYDSVSRGAFGHIYTERVEVVSAYDPTLIALLAEHNRTEANRIRGLLSSDFVPIDWQRDHKSGWRWSEATWHGDVVIEGAPPGADVKIPWELARCQHLPQLALYAMDQDTPPVQANRCAGEFRDVVLDFMSANPPRFGVNWACTMDVAIRVVNWLVAYDLFVSSGRVFDAEFEALFARSVHEHAHHIANHLEWTPWLRTNHYLADVTGLLFACSYLPRTDETNAWLALAVQELFVAIDEQFGLDGGNFEGSTAYHGLSAEIALWGTALVAGMRADEREAVRSADPALVPGPVRLRSGGIDVEGQLVAVRGAVGRIAGFTVATMAPDGRIVQFGDNDSGRLLKIEPRFEVLSAAEAVARFETLAGCPPETSDELFLFEDLLDHGHIAALGDALLGQGSSDLGDMHRSTARICAGLAAGGALLGELSAEATETPVLHASAGQGRVWSSECMNPYEWSFDASGSDLREGIDFSAYPDFGLYVWRSKRLYLAVRCGSVGQLGEAGHAHADQLSLELWIDGIPLVRDPGTGVYSPSPILRNAYRSVGAHFAPRIGQTEPGRFETLFQIAGAVPGVCVRADSLGFIGYHDGYGARVWRELSIEADRVYGSDWSEDGSPVNVRQAPLPFSPGYGIIERGGVS